MNITVNTELLERYPCFTRELSDISEIVIHGTGGGVSPDGLLRWMLSPQGRIEEYKKGVGLFHFVIDRGGEIIKLYDLTRWMYHSSSGQHDRVTVGIELMNPSADNQVEYSSEQYAALAYLVSTICKVASIRTIVGHGYNKLKYSGQYKACPGRFDWFNFGEMLDKNGMSFTASGEALHGDPV